MTVVKLLDRDSSIVPLRQSELDLFTVPPTQTSVEHGCAMDYHPVST